MAKNLFNSIKLSRPRKNVFDLTHDVKLSMNMGDLIPIMVTECVPGDQFKIGASSIVRFAPLLAPVMHRLDVTMHYFFVPNRILWPNWEKFITNTKDPDTDALPVVPYINVDPSNIGFYPLLDYMGIPPTGGLSFEKISMFAAAAYQCVYNEYYRDQNLIDAVNYLLTDGDNSSNATELCKIRKRAWEHDYFTSALPFAQKGDPVTLPVGEFEDVPVKVQKTAEGSGVTTFTASPSNIAVGRQDSTNPDMNDGLYAQTSQLEGTAVKINELRVAFRLQEWLEKAARGGSRYVENILSFFGVKSPDARLQRPEYITGVKSPIVISEVLNTTGTEELPQGNMAGHAFGVASGKFGSYFCQEHGYIIGVMNVQPKTAYQNGIPKHFLKTEDPFQYFWPQFAHVGEQEVLNKEVFAYTPTGNDVFGYVPRYAEYKFENSRVAGDFRSTLAYWHWGRIFTSAPALNKEFIECSPDNRPFAVVSADQKLYCQVLNQVTAVRPMPKFGTPTF